MVEAGVSGVLLLVKYLATFVVYTYMVCFTAWLIVHSFFADRWWWLFLIDSFAVYLFVPLIVVIIFAIVSRQYAPILFSGVAILLFAFMYGGLFVPRGRSLQPGDTSLTVLSYNLLASNPNTDHVIAAIRSAGADVVSLQELSPAVAESIQRELDAEYPYQVLDPQPGVTGLGVISRYPLVDSGASLPGPWIGTPQILTLTLDDTPVTLLNFHNVSIPLGGERWPERVTESIREREQQADVIVEFVKAHPGPLIATADFNASDQSVAYRRVTAVLHDAWRAAGWGLGHTFPGASSEGSSRIRIRGILVPMWLVRIDYVLFSSDWTAVRAHIGPWDGGSDHRPVLTTLKLVR